MYNTQILNRKRNENIQYTDTEQEKKSKCLVNTDQDNKKVARQNFNHSLNTCGS